MRPVVLTIALLALSGTAHATTWTVTTTNDSQDGACAATCSLRDAIGAASAGDVVHVPASSTAYQLTLGQIQITKPITIQGDNRETTVIDAQSRNRIFEITTGVSPTDTVTFDSIKLTEGKAAGDVGGAVLGDRGSGNEVYEHVALNNNSVSFNDNSIGHIGGGAIYDRGAALTITDSEVSGNSVLANSDGGGFNGGGAIWYCPKTSNADLTITDSAFTANTSVTNAGLDVNGGGAIFNTCGTLKVTRTSFDDNTVTSNANCGGCGGGQAFSGGGAILNDSDGGVSLTQSVLRGNTVSALENAAGSNGGGAILLQVGALAIDSTTIADNTANVSDTQEMDGGGGILNVFGTTMTVTSSTISGNTANLSAGSNTRSGGGGILEDTLNGSTFLNTTIAGNTTNVADVQFDGGGGVLLLGDADLTNVTISKNTSSNAPGGGIAIVQSAVGFKSSILAGNSGGGSPNCFDTGDGFASLGYNILAPGASCDSRYTDNTEAGPRLGPLKDNGGLTETMALLPGSPAIDAIPAKACTDQAKPAQALSTDQRGLPRGDKGDGRCDIGAFESQLPRPVNRRPPRVAGAAVQGGALRVVDGGWAFAPTGFVHQWLRCNASGGSCRPIRTGTGVHYLVRAADVGHRLRVREVASNAAGVSRPSRSAPTAVVRARA